MEACPVVFSSSVLRRVSRRSVGAGLPVRFVGVVNELSRTAICESQRRAERVSEIVLDVRTFDALEELVDPKPGQDICRDHTA